MTHVNPVAALKSWTQRGPQAGALRGMLAMMAANHPPTRRHLENVAGYAGLVAPAMGLTSRERRLTQAAALIHDIGKVVIPGRILEKPGYLDLDEAALMMQHPEYGAGILASCGGCEALIEPVRCHHEWWDGRGYPGGIQGTDLPLASRIIAVADAFDTMTTPRAYRPQVFLDAALAELGRCAGSQFDPRVVAAMQAVAGRALRAGDEWARALADGSALDPEGPRTLAELYGWQGDRT